MHIQRGRTLNARALANDLRFACKRRPECLFETDLPVSKARDVFLSIEAMKIRTADEPKETA